MYPTRKQNTELARTLKRFAFEQSPLFQEGRIQAMDVSQSFELIEKVPEESWLPGTLQHDQIRIKLGFYATRFRDEPKGPAAYVYNVTTVGTQAIHPRQLNIADESWHVLWEKYMDDEPDYPDDEPEEGALISADAVSDSMKEDVIDTLIDAGAECELYQKSMLSFSTHESGIESSYERGVNVEETLLDAVSTHDYIEDEWEACQTADGLLYIPNRQAPDELPIGDEIEVRSQFLDIIRAYGTDQEAAEFGFLPHEDKLHEMLYVLECLRKRRIEL